MLPPGVSVFTTVIVVAVVAPSTFPALGLLSASVNLSEYTTHVLDKVDTEAFRFMPFRSPAGGELYEYAKSLMAMKSIYSLGLGNWSNVLYFDFSNA